MCESQNALASSFADPEKGSTDICGISKGSEWELLLLPSPSSSRHAASGEQSPPPSSSLPPCYCRAGHCVEKSRPVFLYVPQLYNVYRKSSCFSKCFINFLSEKALLTQASVCWHHNTKLSVSHNRTFSVLWNWLAQQPEHLVLFYFLLL